MLIKDLTNEQLIILADKRPEWIADNHPKLADVPPEILQLLSEAK